MRAFVYILASRRNGTLYIGSTDDLALRVWQHRNGKGSVFCRKYRVVHLVDIEGYDTTAEAILREKCLKRWKRAWKLRLIEERNSDWRDLYDDLNDIL